MYSAFPWLGFIFWFGLFSWFGIRAWASYLRELERQKTLRIFAERGTPLDKEMMERLFPPGNPRQSDSWRASPLVIARGLAIGGIVCVSASLGLLIGAQLISRIQPDALYGMSTGGVMAGCVGLGLLISGIVVRVMHVRDIERASGTSDDSR